MAVKLVYYLIVITDKIIDSQFPNSFCKLFKTLHSSIECNTFELCNFFLEIPLKILIHDITLPSIKNVHVLNLEKHI